MATEAVVASLIFVYNIIIPTLFIFPNRPEKARGDMLPPRPPNDAQGSYTKITYEL